MELHFYAYQFLPNRNNSFTLFIKEIQVSIRTKQHGVVRSNVEKRHFVDLHKSSVSCTKESRSCNIFWWNYNFCWWIERQAGRKGRLRDGFNSSWNSPQFRTTNPLRYIDFCKSRLYVNSFLCILLCLMCEATNLRLYIQLVLLRSEETPFTFHFEWFHFIQKKQ